MILPAIHLGSKFVYRELLCFARLNVTYILDKEFETLSFSRAGEELFFLMGNERRPRCKVIPLKWIKGVVLGVEIKIVPVLIIRIKLSSDIKWNF